MSKLSMKKCLELRHFESMDAFLNYCDAGDNCDANAWSSGHRSSDSGTEDFTGSKSYKAASLLARNGWPEGVQKINAAVNVQVEGIDSVTMIEDSFEVTGVVPIVPAYLGGEPECMYNPVTEHVKPVLNVVVDLRCSGGIETANMVNRGAAILRLVSMIEDSGKRVAIHLCDVASNDGYWHSYFVQVKAAELDFNLHTLSYALVHSSMLRRHGFRVTEALPRSEHSECFESGYGMPRRMNDIEGVEAAIGTVDLYIPKIEYAEFETVQEGIDLIFGMARDQGVIS